MKPNIKLLVGSLIVAVLMQIHVSYAQSNILNAQSPEEIGLKTLDQIEADNDQPLEYGYVDDRDIMFSKMTWEKVVLDERVNFPYYFPVDTNNIGNNRRSLFDVLLKAVKEGYIKDVYADSYFKSKRKLEDIGGSLSRIDTLDIGYEQFNAEGFVSPEYITKRNITSYDISAYLIKGLWYFDKRQAELKYRILAIAPAAPDVNFIDTDDAANREPVPLFWIFYPDARYVLHDAKAFNRENSAKSYSFDHLLNSRRFHGIIYKMENIYGDRRVEEYISDNALLQLLESRRLKEQIRNFELDMWAY